jgi:putative methanogenesis marker protein 8
MYHSEYKCSVINEYINLEFRLPFFNWDLFFPKIQRIEFYNRTLLREEIEKAISSYIQQGKVLTVEINEVMQVGCNHLGSIEMNELIDLILITIQDVLEKNESHVTRMFGSFILIKKKDNDLSALLATEIPIQYCPLMMKLLEEVGGNTVKELLDATKMKNIEMQKKRMLELINFSVIKGGYFSKNRPLNSCEVNVIFGASEIMSTAFNNGLIDCAVIVSNNLGTIIATNNSNIQGSVMRMTGLFYTSPSKELIEIASIAKIIPVFPHTAIIDQYEGVKMAIELGYKKIAVSIAWEDNSQIYKIRSLQKEGIEIIIFTVCTTGIKDSTAKEILAGADIIWSCASKAVKEYIEPNSIIQIGIKIPVYVMTIKGWNIIKPHIEKISNTKKNNYLDLNKVMLAKGDARPIIINEEKTIKIDIKKNIHSCNDCPSPCI